MFWVKNTQYLHNRIVDLRPVGLRLGYPYGRWMNDGGNVSVSVVCAGEFSGDVVDHPNARPDASPPAFWRRTTSNISISIVGSRC